MIKALSGITAIILTVTVIISCSKSGGPADDDPGNGGGGNGGGSTVDCNTVPKLFSANVNPIIQSFCNQATCHDAGSSNGPGPLTNYSEIFNARSGIRNAVSSGSMPQNTTLTAAQKNTITCWIDSGALNN